MLTSGEPQLRNACGCNVGSRNVVYFRLFQTPCLLCRVCMTQLPFPQQQASTGSWLSIMSASREFYRGR